MLIRHTAGQTRSGSSEPRKALSHTEPDELRLASLRGCAGDNADSHRVLSKVGILSVPQTLEFFAGHPVFLSSF